jgi:hypothetical protein
LEDAGVLRPIFVGRRRNRAWEAPEVVALLDNFRVGPLGPYAVSGAEASRSTPSSTVGPAVLMLVREDPVIWSRRCVVPNLSALSVIDDTVAALEVRRHLADDVGTGQGLHSFVLTRRPVGA